MLRNPEGGVTGSPGVDGEQRLTGRAAQLGSKDFCRGISEQGHSRRCDSKLMDLEGDTGVLSGLIGVAWRGEGR